MNRPCVRLALAFAIIFLSVAAEKSSAVALGELERWLAEPRAERPPLAKAPFGKTPLNKMDAAAAMTALWQDQAAYLRTNRAAEMRAKVIELGGLRMRFDWMNFGDINAPPTNGRSLFLSLHGGGSAPKEVNDSQWANQIRLGKSYRPTEGIYIAPRAPTDAWNMWHQAHIDDFINRLIEDFVAIENVNPNRVYVLGYSAGGDGVYQIVPRTPDRWAAAAMMAGHPNESSPLGLRNVPFAIQVGANDSAHHRNEVAAEWGRKLDTLELADPQGYLHFTELHAGKGHWMDMEDRKAIPWMEKFSRRPLPEKVVWHQDDVTHTRCYWLARPQSEVKAGQKLTATNDGQVITLTSTNVDTVTVLLNDALLDLDQPVVIRNGGQLLFSNLVSRTIATLAETLEARGDSNLAFCAAVTVNLLPPTGVRWWSAAAQKTLQAAGTNSAALAEALQTVPVAQREGMQFLIENMPLPDRETLSATSLVGNVALAYEALAAASWGRQIPPDIFLNDILPYAVVNEARDNWRERLRDLCAPLVRDCRTPGEAALAVNGKLFKLVRVRYSTKREKADQSPAESMKSGLATCTGLSILLVDACRAVGIPARIAGTPLWTNLRGNHTWVEVWDGGWHFVGAAEPDAAGLDRGWFVRDASAALKDKPEHAIYASSFRSTGLAFPLVWATDINWVNAVNVTDRYTKKAAASARMVRLLVKVVDSKGQRLAAQVTVSDFKDADKKLEGKSRDESADLNDILSFNWPVGMQCHIRAEHGRHAGQGTVSTQTNGEQVVVIRLDE